MQAAQAQREQAVIDAEVAMTVVSRAWRRRRSKRGSELNSSVDTYISAGNAAMARLRAFLDSSRHIHS